jgi:hypothetical protein
MKTRLRTHGVPVLLLGAVLLTLFAPAGGAGGHKATDDKGATFRWDIVSIDFAAGTLNPGGVAASLAHDGSQIVLTGTGTFRVDHPKQVTGGGTWQTFSAGGAPTGSGTFEVTRLVDFELAPGTLPPLTDNIGNAADARAGLVHLQIAYSDGSRGVFVISCHLVGSPDSMYEGVTASKGVVDYFNRLQPIPGVDANRNVFHVVP